MDGTHLETSMTGKQLAEARKGLGMTQKQFAKQIAMSIGSVRRMEQGTMEVHERTVIILNTLTNTQKR